MWTFVLSSTVQLDRFCVQMWELAELLCTGQTPLNTSNFATFVNTPDSHGLYCKWGCRGLKNNIDWFENGLDNDRVGQGSHLGPNCRLYWALVRNKVRMQMLVLWCWPTRTGTAPVSVFRVYPCVSEWLIEPLSCCRTARSEKKSTGGRAHSQPRTLIKTCLLRCNVAPPVYAAFSSLGLLPLRGVNAAPRLWLGGEPDLGLTL